MRVLIANSFYAPQVVGGAELSVQGIAEQLAAWGVEVSVLTTGDADQDDTLNGVHVVRRRFYGLMPYGTHREARTSLVKILNKPLTIDNPLNRHTIDAVLRDVRPQVVLSNNLLGITPQLWRGAKSIGIPVMHTVRDYALLCPNSTLICRGHQGCTTSPRVMCKLMRTRLRRVCVLVDEVAAPSRYALDMHGQRGYFQETKMCVIPNAVKFDQSHVDEAVRFRRELPHTGPLRIAYLGRLVEEKGFTDLLEAVGMCASGEVELHVAGRGPLERLAQEKAEAGSHIKLHGFLSQAEVDELLMTCDVLAAPSRYAETFGRVVLDAYRNAMPAIVSDTGALPEVLCEGAGVVTQAGNARALHEAIMGYVRDRQRVCEEGIRGARAMSTYTVAHQARRFLDELEGLL